jgi:hypothetical protein
MPCILCATICASWSEAQVPISKRSEYPDPSGYREAPARPFAQGGERKFEYFQIFSNVSHHFSNIFKRFAPVFERFRIFSNATCAFGRAFIFPSLPNRCILTPSPLFLT